jgi:iron complex outermembrane receptor protein
MKRQVKKTERFFAYSVCVSALMAAFPAQAQSKTEVLEKVVVTGSNIKRTDLEGPAPVTLINREEIERSAAATVGDFVRNLTVNSGNSYSESSVNNQSGAAGVSLRGLGQKSTLVLVNGRRMANHAFSQDQSTFVDINSIPRAAIERIEILKDGASAIYGSDAIAGVVNFILKKNYQGATVSANAGTSTEGGLGERSLSFAAGFGDLATDKYNVLAVVDYFHRDRLMLTDREFVGPGADFRSRPGGGLPFTSSSAGTWVQPAGTPGGSRAPFKPCLGNGKEMPGSLFFASGTVCANNTAAYITAFPEADRLGLMTRGVWEIAPDLSAFAEFSYANNGSKWINQQQSMTTATVSLDPVTHLPKLFSVSIPANNPSNPYGKAANLRYTFFDVGPRELELQTDAYRLMAGLNGTTGKWDWEAAIGVSESKIVQDTHNQVDAFALTKAITAGTYNFAAPTAAQTEMLRIGTQRNALSKLSFVDGKATTSFAELAGGPLGFALGFDIRHESMEDNPDPFITEGRILGSGASAIDGTRSTTAAYVELNAPFTKQFEVQLAARADHYSDFGDAFTPKIGAKWVPMPELLFRASYNKGFRAPTLVENAQSTALSFTSVVDPTKGNIGSYVATINQGNPNLGPEKSDAYSFGMIFEPNKALTAGLDYYAIDQRNLVAANGFQYMVNNETLFRSNIVRDPATGVIQTIYDSYSNIAKVTTSGIDADVRYKFYDLVPGKLTVRSNISYLLSWKQPPAAGKDLKEFAGANAGPAGALPRIRAKLGADWDLGKFTTSFNVNYTDKYRQMGTTFNAATALEFVPSQTTMDLYFAYTGFKDIKLVASVQNLADKQPPFDPADKTTAMYSSSQYDLRGRYVRLGVEYKFK